MLFESRLDTFWGNQSRKYNYSHEIVINTTGHDLNVNEYFLMSSLECVLYSLYWWPHVVDSSLVRWKLDTSSSYLPVRIL
jgi:hypothetical protein